MTCKLAAILRRASLIAFIAVSVVGPVAIVWAIESGNLSRVAK